MVSAFFSLCLLGLCLFAAPFDASAQVPTIAHIQPDMAAPGMTIALEILAPADAIQPYGPDGIAPEGLSIRLVNPIDSQRLVFGVPVVSWRGRMIQVPVFVHPSAYFDTVKFRVVRGSSVGNSASFYIGDPAPAIKIVGSVTFGDGGLGGTLSRGNTLLVDSIDINAELVNRGVLEFERRDPDPSAPGNPRLLPITILSAGPIRLTDVNLHLEGRGKNGAPGGGGGGSGNQGTGGEGFTGGGSSTATSDSNVGSASYPTVSFGGSAPTGVIGGASNQSDQGGGGGTGHPFGRSGAAGLQLLDSPPGGYGGGSAGGELPDLHYGGGGGGFAEDAKPGGGVGDNGGKRTGGRLLIPLAGGSGGGAGNSLDEDIAPAGSGGGAGGALSLVAFDSIILRNTTVLAMGDSGTTGVSNTGSGGGGSGGGFIASSNTAVVGVRLDVNVDGGSGGSNTANGLAGGDGSEGMARIDGYDSCIACALPVHEHRSISQRRLPRQTAPFITVGGIAGSTDAFTDSIRIYYRNYHTGWIRVDTVSFVLNGKRQWKKTIPAFSDSLLFVSAFQKISSPRNAQFDLDPQWISTHVSHQIVRTRSKAQVIAPDTIRFPDTKVGRCTDSSVKIRNMGEAPLHVTSIEVPQPFRSEAGSLQIPGYTDSLFKLLFCPATVGCKDTTMVLHTNAGDRTIVLIGCGIETDERVHIDPTLLIFRDTKVGECDSGTVTIRLLGSDETTINFTSLFNPPFYIDTIGKKHTLKPGSESERVETFTVRFCPSDSGMFRDTTNLDGPEQTFAVQGKGLRRILVKRDTLFDGDACLNYTLVIEDTIVNRGNDTITIDNIVTSAVQLRSLAMLPPWKIAPGAKRIFQFELSPSGVGVAEYSIRYQNGSDSVASAYVRANANQRAVTLSVPDFYACAQQTDEQRLRVSNTGSKVVSISIDGFDSKFFPLDLTTFDLPPGDRDVAIRFDPQVVGEFFDTIDVIVSTQGCGDTTLSVVLHGSGTEKTLVFSKSELDFGDVEIGSCAEDSIFITNVCGPAALVDPQDLLPSQGFTTDLLQPVMLQTGEGIWVVYRFCPISGGASSAIHRMTAQDSIVEIELNGVGKSPPDQKKVYLSVENALIAIGSIGSTDVVLDSVSKGFVVSDLDISIAFSPELLRLVRIEALSGSIVQINVDSALGLIHLTLDRPSASRLLRITWLGLLGSSSRALITLHDVTTTPESQALGVSGEVELVDCFGLAGNVQVGRIAVALIKPQPVSDVLGLLVQSPSMLHASILITDASGRALFSLAADLQEGLQRIPIDIRSLPSGAYWIRVESAGSSEIQRFWK